MVPKPVPAGAIVVAANAGSDYLFVPDGNIDTVKAAVTSLQNAVNCAPSEDSQGDENSKGKEKGHDKHDGGLTVVTGTTTATTTGEGD